MEIFKKCIFSIAMFIFFATMAFGGLLFIIGGIRCIYCLVTDIAPTQLEWFGLIILLMMCGSTGVVLYLTETT